MIEIEQFVLQKRWLGAIVGRPGRATMLSDGMTGSRLDLAIASWIS